MANLTSLLLADTSAWHRSGTLSVADQWEDALNDKRIATTAPIRLEVLYSAQTARDYDLTVFQLDLLRQLPCSDSAWSRAAEVQRELAHKAALHHRSVRLPDLLVAAVAELEGAVVWHYDEDFDRVAEVTGQPMEWVAPRGSL